MNTTAPWLDFNPELFLNAIRTGGDIGIAQRRNDLEANQQVLSSNEADQRTKQQAVAELDAALEQQKQDQERQREYLSTLANEKEQFSASQGLQRDVLNQRNEMQAASLDAKQQQNEAADALRASQLQNQLLMGQDRIQNTADRTGVMADAASGLNDYRQNQTAVAWSKLDADDQKRQQDAAGKIPPAVSMEWKDALDRRRALFSAVIEGKAPSDDNTKAAGAALDAKISQFENQFGGTSTGTNRPAAADLTPGGQPDTAPPFANPKLDVAPNEVERMTKDGRTAIFDSNTKQFIRYAD